MPTPLVSFPLDGTLQGRGWIDTATATTTGAVRFDKGKAYVEGSATNLEVRPYANTSLWGNSFGSVLSVYDGTVQYKGRGGSTKLTAQAAGTGAWGLVRNTGRPAATPGLAYSSSIRFKLKPGFDLTKTARAHIRFYDAASGGAAVGAAIETSYVLSSLVPDNDGWVTISVANAVCPVGATNIVYGGYILTNTPGSGEEYWISGILAMQKDHIVDIVPRYEAAVLQPGNAWNGTVDASTSTRTAGELVLPCPQQPSSIALRYSEDGVTYRTLYSASLGQVIGSYGSITWSAGALRITSSRQLWVDRVFAYDVPLNPQEQARIQSWIEVGRADRDTLEQGHGPRYYSPAVWWLYQ